MSREPVRLFVPYSVDTPWIVRREVVRVGTFRDRPEAIRAALAMRAKLSRAWDCEHPPVQVQELDGSWREVDEAGLVASP